MTHELTKLQNVLVCSRGSLSDEPKNLILSSWRIRVLHARARMKPHSLHARKPIGHLPVIILRLRPCRRPPCHHSTVELQLELAELAGLEATSLVKLTPLTHHELLNTLPAHSISKALRRMTEYLTEWSQTFWHYLLVLCLHIRFRNGLKHMTECPHIFFR